MKKSALFAACVIALGNAQAKLVTKSVPYEKDGVKLEGYLAYDDAKTQPGKTPGVLVFPEWWGLNSYIHGRAEQLANMGYVAFAVDMYGASVVTEDPKKAGELAGQVKGKPVMVERAQAGLEQLKKVDQVDPTKIAAIGFCFGGSACQVLAYSGAPIAGIVSFHGGPMPAPEDVAGRVKTKFLLLNGAIDPMVKPDDRIGLEKSLEKVGIDYQSIDYSGAVHAFTNPNATKIAEEKGMVGIIAYNETAEKRSWQQMGVFFNEIFGVK